MGAQHEPHDDAAARYVIKDLVPDFSNFAEQYKSIQPWLQTKAPKAHEGEILQTQVGAL